MKSDFNKILPKSEFAKNVLTLMTGTTIAQAIPIVISPILTRLYTPEDFGLLTLYMSIVSILSVIITGRYELAILLPKKQVNANAIVVLIFYTSLSLSIVFFCIIFIWKKQIIDFFNIKELSSWIYLIPVSVLLVGWYQGLNYWVNRQGKFTDLAVSNLSQTTATASSNLIFGYGNFFKGGLVIGGLIGQFINVCILGRLFFKEKIFKSTPQEDVKKMAVRYINFPKITMFSGVINMSAKELPKTIISSVFGTGALGFLSLAQRMLVIPIALISSSTTSVFFKYASEEYKQKKKAIEIYDKTLKKLVLIAIVPMVLAFFLAPALFSFIFGEKWIVAGEITQLLIPFYFCYFVGAPLNAMFAIAEKQKQEMIWQVIFFVLSVSSILIGKFLEADIKLTILMFSIANSLVFILSIFMTRKIAKGD